MHIVSYISGLWRHSIRGQLIAGFGLASFTLLLGFGYLLLEQQREFMQRSADESATSLAHALSISGASWALANDLVGLQEVVQGFAKTPDLQRAYFVSPRGEVLASTRAGEVGLFVTDQLSRSMLASTSTDAIVLMSRRNLIVIAHPVMLGERRHGWVCVEMTRDSVNANLDTLYKVWLGFVLFAVLVVALVAVFLARSLTHGLSHLMQIAAEVERGRTDLRSDVGRGDEIGVLARHLDRMVDSLVRANADLTRFADVSAHHLMEPTRRLSIYTQQLKAQVMALPAASQEDEIVSSLAYIERDASRLRTLVRDVQLYLAAATPRGEVRMEDSNAVVSAMRARLAPQLAQQRVELEVGDLPKVMLDRPRLTDLFSLLLDNALQYGLPDDPNVVPRIRISGERGHGLSRFRVRDNGGGIPAEYLERVFEIFERLHAANRDSGTGIGLSIARRIVESRHGKIWIENLPEGGAMVVFELPDGM
jgi:signal transduction histidine kinase